MKQKLSKMVQLLAVALIGLVGLSACSKVPAGNIGIKVYLLGNEKGVDSETLGVGRYWIGWNEDLFLFPTYAQNRNWEEPIKFQTVEGLSVSGNFGITYNLDPLKIPILFQKYRKGVDEITDIYLRNMVRDALNSHASKMEVESVYGKGKEELMRKTQESIIAQVSPYGINIDKIYIINDLDLPENVKTAINAKIGAIQKSQQRENEVAQAKAEALKLIEEAKGIAESNLLKSKSLTPELINWETLQIQRLQMEKWNGHMPTTVLGNSSGLIYNLNNK